MIVFWIALAIGLVYITIQIWQLITLLRYRHRYLPEPASWPEISILIAARNEEDNIKQCLDSLINWIIRQIKSILFVEMTKAPIIRG